MIGHLIGHLIGHRLIVRSKKRQADDPCSDDPISSECAFLGKAEARQGYSLARFRDFDLYHGRIGRGDFGRP